MYILLRRGNWVGAMGAVSCIAKEFTNALANTRKFCPYSEVFTDLRASPGTVQDDSNDDDHNGSVT